MPNLDRNYNNIFSLILHEISTEGGTAMEVIFTLQSQFVQRSNRSESEDKVSFRSSKVFRQMKLRF